MGGSRKVFLTVLAAESPDQGLTVWFSGSGSHPTLEIAAFMLYPHSERRNRAEMRAKNNDRGEGKGERSREGRENTNLPFQETCRVKALSSQPSSNVITSL